MPPRLSRPGVGARHEWRLEAEIRVDTSIDHQSAAPHRLAHFPVALFASVMGMAGLAIAWLKAAQTGLVPELISSGLRWLATILFAFLLLVYLTKLLRHRAAVMAERTHPLKQNFFPAISIGLLLLAIAWAHTAPTTARCLWGVGAALHLVFTLMAMSGWIHHAHFEIGHANPAWFIPVVGNILVPVVGTGFAPPDISWFFFSILHVPDVDGASRRQPDAYLGSPAGGLAEHRQQPSPDESDPADRWCRRARHGGTALSAAGLEYPRVSRCR